MVETVLKKIVEHITDQCLICCDVGVPCNARQACNDPSSLIFPFQVGIVSVNLQNLATYFSLKKEKSQLIMSFRKKELSKLIEIGFRNQIVTF